MPYICISCIFCNHLVQKGIVHKFENLSNFEKKIKKLNKFSVLKLFIKVIEFHTIAMSEMTIPKCECPPGSETYLNEDGMPICVSCNGWVMPD